MSVLKRVLRLEAIVPLMVVFVLVGIVWSLLVDRMVERGIEHVGALIVGARVDLAKADLRLRDGSVVLRGLEVTNPDKPMTNLFVADEIVADLALRPLLEKKVVIDTMAVRGVRFGTERATSGALDRPGEASEQSRGLVAQWADRLRVPPLSFEGLQSVVDVATLSPDSLRSLEIARATVDRSAALRGEWEATLAELDPNPRIDTARSLVQQLRNFNPLRLGPSGIANLANDSRSTLVALESMRGELAALDTASRAGVAGLQAMVRELEDARNADYAYARGSMQLPSLSAPDLSTSIFGNAVIQWVRPVLYWAQMAERFIPPGLDPRNRPGSRRMRRPGTDVSFPGRSMYPQFLLRHGEVDLELGGDGGAAGSYAALVQGLTTDPSLYGRPTEIRVRRADGSVGPQGLDAVAILDHVASPSEDSLALTAAGVTLPTFDLDPLGARLALGQGNTRFALQRQGDDITAAIGWDAASVTWERLAAAPATGAVPAIGTKAWAEDLLWRTVSDLAQVSVDVQLGGSFTEPTIGVTSNVGDAVSQALQRELGRELQRAEQRLRSEVDRLVAAPIQEARSAVGSLATLVSERIGVPLADLDAVEAELREELRKLGRE